MLRLVLKRYRSNSYKGKDLADEIENIENQNKAIQESNYKLIAENKKALESELMAVEEKEKLYKAKGRP